MRVKPQKYEKIKNAIRAVADHYGPANVKADVGKEVNGKPLTPMGMMWALFTVADRNMRYDDTHPHFQSGRWVRIIPTDPSFDMYSDGDNDQHLATALKKIGKELGLI